MDTVRCRHCHAFTLPEADRCPVCHGADPDGRRFALLGSVFLGALASAGLVVVFAFGLWWKWHRWQALFGESDDMTAIENARRTAVLAGGLLFVVGSYVAAAVAHKVFQSADSRPRCPPRRS
jgi:hypothetical protein